MALDPVSPSRPHLDRAVSKIVVLAVGKAPQTPVQDRVTVTWKR